MVDVDADGSALKADRFLWSIPRIKHVEENGNEIDAANPALRSPGLTIARTGQGATSKERVSTQNGYDATFRTSDELTDELAAEDVTRGMRVEVWDDHSGTWHSLHTRRTLFTDDRDQEIVELDNDGFIQGTSATTTPGADDTKPVYVHEAMFGWEGWSLSAPRPGRRIRPATPDEYAAMPADDKRTEIVEDADTPDPHARTSPHPFRFRHRVKGGTLPRLRFGRSYAFRAWQVDLAGNVRPAPGPALPVAPDDLTATLEQLGQVTPTTVHADGAPLWSAALRETTATLLTTRALGAATEVEPEPVLDDGLRDVLVSPDARPDPAAAGRTRTRGGRVAARPGRLARRAGRHRHHPSALRRHHPRRRREPVAAGRGAPGAPRPRRQPLGGRGRGTQDRHQARAVPAVGPGAAARRGRPLAARRGRVAAGAWWSAAASPRTSPPARSP